VKEENFLVDFGKIDLLKTKSLNAIQRLNWRAELLIARNKFAMEDKRILDLACNNGRLSYVCLKSGAKNVVGVEGRSHLVKRANEWVAPKFPEKAVFIQDDIFEYLSRVEPGTFDTVLCLGFLYHTTRQEELFRKIKRIRPEYLIVDSYVDRNVFSITRFGPKYSPSLTFKFENPEKEGTTIEENGLIATPTKSFIEMMLKTYGFSFEEIVFKKSGIGNWTGLKDYKKKKRVSFLARTKG
jgi:SAM-dependent methyltransferase